MQHIRLISTQCEHHLYLLHYCSPFAPTRVHTTSTCVCALYMQMISFIRRPDHIVHGYGFHHGCGYATRTMILCI